MYYAHVSEDKTRQQTIIAHSEGTAFLAGKFAEAFDCSEWGKNCGLVHDIGKYSRSFQRRLLEDGPKTDHATAGAIELVNRKEYRAAYCVAGHHGGLPDGGTEGDTFEETGIKTTLQGRKNKKVDDYSAFVQEIAIPHFPAIPLKPLGKGGFSLSFFIRMLYSCLVDADYLDTEDFMLNGIVDRGKYDSMQQLWEKLHMHIGKWLESKATDDTVNGRRTTILKACISQGDKPQGIYRLTEPTGAGKTISSLAFALKHALKHELQRIIYVIPYTSIIEQNAKIFKDILGEQNVLEDHSNVSYRDDDELRKCQLAAENWDRPLVVTTNVQFFESFFANKSTKCRKLHNVAKSIIIFDEAQMLPISYLKPCVQAISELVYNYHSTAVLCTATQPALDVFFPKQLSITELCPKVEEQFAFFQRTRIEQVGELSQEELVTQLQMKKQVLCILNSRKQVQQIYQNLAEQEDGTYHLSTLMYPIHRKGLLETIRDRLKKQLPCRLIATSLVEAGVDFDFPCVYRELAGIDSVIQAAGRCNREGKSDKEDCKTVVFTLLQSEKNHIPPALKLPIALGREIAAKYDDVSALDAIQEYFQRLYYHKADGLDAKGIVEAFERGARSQMFPFASIASQFKLIEEDTKTILITDEPEACEIEKCIRRGEYSRQLLRRAQQYSVNVYENDFEALMGAGRLEEIDEAFYVLRNEEQYTKEQGLVIEVSRGEAVFG